MKKLLTSLAALLTLSSAAFAQVPVNPPAGGLTQATADARYCALAGCTMVGNISLPANGTLFFGAADASHVKIIASGAQLFFNLADNSGGTSATANNFISAGTARANDAVAVAAGGTTTGFLFSSTANFGLVAGSGVPTISMARGTLYLRSDGLPYYNTNGTTGWDQLAGLAATNTFTGAQTLSAALTYGGVTLSNAVTGTGNMVLSAGPTLTGTTNFATLTGTGAVTAYNATAIPASGTTGVGFSFSSTANLGIYFGSGAPTLTGSKGAQYLRTGTGTIYSNVDGSTNWIPASTQMMSPTTTTSTTYTWGASDAITYFNAAGTVTVTLPTAANFPHRVLYMKTITAQLLNSASSNVVPLTSTTAGTAILAATAGKWAVLVSDGTNWTQMAGN